MHDLSTKVSGPKRKQRGIALLICIFALLLVTGIALLVEITCDGLASRYCEQSPHVPSSGCSL